MATKRKSKKKQVTEKSLFSTKYFTTSKINIHYAQVLALIIFIFVMYMCKYLKNDTIQLAAVLASLIGCASYIVKTSHDTYNKKAISDSESKDRQEKYKMKLHFAEMMSQLMADGKITANGVNNLKTLVSETETTLATNGYGGSTVIEQQTFGVQNPMVDTPIIDNTLDVNSNLSDQRYT